MAIEVARRSSGRFIIATNDLDTQRLPAKAMLENYKDQGVLVERGIRFLKDPPFFARLSRPKTLSVRFLRCEMWDRSLHISNIRSPVWLQSAHGNVVEMVNDFCGRTPTKIVHHKTSLKTFIAPMYSTDFIAT